MRVLNLLSTGGIGGIEVLCLDIGKNAEYKNTFCFLFGAGEIYNEMQKNGLSVVDISKKEKGITLKKVMCLVKLSKEYDIIVAHHGSINMHLCFWLLSILNRQAKLVLMAHSCFEKHTYYYSNPIKTVIRKFVLKKAISCANKIIYVSEAGRQSFLDNFNIDRSKTAVVYNGVSNELLTMGKENIPQFDSELRILYIGRLAKVKGIDLLIKSVAEFQKECSVKVSIVGDGAERKALEQLVADLGLENIVQFEGSRRDKGQFYKWANVFAYPSTCQEIFGISIVEAMAYGLPCIANRVGGIPEIIKNGENGFLTEAIGYKEIANTLRGIYNLYRLGKMSNLIENARKTATQFSIDNTVKELFQEYTNLPPKVEM